MAWGSLGPRVAVQFSPKILGLFLDNLGLNFRLLLNCVCCFYVLLLKKMNNMLVV